MLSHLDLAQLQKTLWTDTAADQGIGTISCGEFSDDELRDAVTRLHERGYANIETDRLPASVINQLHDPYLFGTIAEASHQGMPAIPGAGVYQRAFEAKLQRRASLIDTATLKDVLASLALGSLSGQQDKFREIDIEPAAMRGEIVRLMKDLHVFVEAGDGYLQFDHDQPWNSFWPSAWDPDGDPASKPSRICSGFSKRLERRPSPSLQRVSISRFVRGKDSGIIERGFAHAGRRECPVRNCRPRTPVRIGREVLLEMTEQGEQIARQYLMDVSKAASSSEVGPHLVRAVVQFGAGLPVEESMQVLTNISHAVSSLAAIEANIYATDKLVTLYLEAGCPDVLLSRDQPYAAFFGDARCPTWQRLGRLLGFAAHLGPDNTHPDEYSSTLHILNGSLDLLLREPPWVGDEAAAITRHFKESETGSFSTRRPKPSTNSSKAAIAPDWPTLPKSSEREAFSGRRTSRFCGRTHRHCRPKSTITFAICSWRFRASIIAMRPSASWRRGSLRCRTLRLRLKSISCTPRSFICTCSTTCRTTPAVSRTSKGGSCRVGRTSSVRPGLGAGADAGDFRISSTAFSKTDLVSSTPMAYSCLLSGGAALLQGLPSGNARRAGKSVAAVYEISRRVSRFRQDRGSPAGTPGVGRRHRALAHRGATHAARRDRLSGSPHPQGRRPRSRGGFQSTPGRNALVPQVQRRRRKRRRSDRDQDPAGRELVDAKSTKKNGRASAISCSRARSEESRRGLRPRMTAAECPTTP